MHRKGKTKKQNIISESDGSSGETFCGTLEGAYHSNDKPIISENVWNLLEDEGEARTDELGNITLANMDVIRARAAEFHYEVVAVKVNTRWYRLPQSRRRVYLVFANSRFCGITPAETCALLAQVRDIFVSLGDKTCKHPPLSDLGSLFERMGSARDRSSTHRDTQWRRWPGGWSTPCVLAFLLDPDSLVILDTVGGCKKSALE